MIHYTTADFWKHYNSLPFNMQKLADKNFDLLKSEPQHPSLKLKPIRNYWSVRVGIHYRALGVNAPDKRGIIWFWIGSHESYNKLIKNEKK